MYAGNSRAGKWGQSINFRGAKPPPPGPPLATWLAYLCIWRHPPNHLWRQIFASPDDDQKTHFSADLTKCPSKKLTYLKCANWITKTRSPWTRMNKHYADLVNVKKTCNMRALLTALRWHIFKTKISNILKPGVGYTGKIFKILSSKFFWVGKHVSRREKTKKALQVK